MHDYLAWYDAMREAERVLWHEETQSWYVTRFDDVWNLLVDSRLGARSPTTFSDRMTPDQRNLCAPIIEFVSKWPVFSDAPRHTVIHRTILPCFSTREVDVIAEAVRLHLAAAGGAAWRSDDLLADVIRPACEAGLAAFIGITRDELADVSEWSARIIAFVGQTEYHDEIMRRAAVALREFDEFVVQACAAERSTLSSVMRRAVERGDLDRSDVVAVYGQLVTGFLEPTVSAIAMAFETLLNDPAAAAAFHLDPGTFIAESVRLASPFHFSVRRALTDIDLAGQVIPAGERIVLLLVSANRDPRRFPEPLKFRMDRGQPPHLAFSRGRYACLGAGITRQVAQIVLSEIVRSPVALAPERKVSWSIGRGMRMPQSIKRVPM